MAIQYFSNNVFGIIEFLKQKNILYHFEKLKEEQFNEILMDIENSMTEFEDKDGYIQEKELTNYIYQNYKEIFIKEDFSTSFSIL